MIDGNSVNTRNGGEGGGGGEDEGEIDDEADMLPEERKYLNAIRKFYGNKGGIEGQVS